MHVCYLFHKRFPQNYSTGTNEYPRILSDLGIEVTVIAATTDDQPQREPINGIDVYRIPTPELGKKSLASSRFAYRGLRKLNQLCQRKSIDILHMSAFPNLGLLLRPVPWLDTPDHVVVDIRGTATSNRFWNTVSKAMLNVQARLVDTLLTLDPLMAEDIFGDRAAAEVVPLGADFDRFRPGDGSETRQALGLSSEDIVFGYTGILSQVRKLDQVIDAFASVHETHPRAKLVFVGDGDARDDLERRAVRAGCVDAVTFTGEVPFSDMPRYVRAFDVGFAHIPNRQPFRTQPPLKTVEFLASGLPVVATNTPGNRRFIEDGENGILCPESTAAYVSAIRKLTDSHVLRKRLGASAREAVREYDYTHIVQNSLLPLYKQMTDAEHRSEDMAQNISQ